MIDKALSLLRGVKGNPSSMWKLLPVLWHGCPGSSYQLGTSTRGMKLQALSYVHREDARHSKCKSPSPQALFRREPHGPYGIIVPLK